MHVILFTEEGVPIPEYTGTGQEGGSPRKDHWSERILPTKVG